jgi:hypothetical protein
MCVRKREGGDRNQYYYEHRRKRLREGEVGRGRGK